MSRSKLAEAAASRILEALREQGLEAGTRLPSERELMSSLGVGRSTIREAVNGLVMLGVIEIRHGQGAFVANPDAGYAHSRLLSLALARGVTRDLFEARLVIEPRAARLAAERRTEADLRRIADCLAEHERAIAEGISTVGPAVEFHVLIGESAHNEVLAGLVSAFRDPLANRGPLLEAVPGYADWEITEHRSVFEPIEAGAPEAAALRMRAHLDAVLARHKEVGLS